MNAVIILNVKFSKWNHENDPTLGELHLVSKLHICKAI